MERVLAESRLVRVIGALPTERPDRTSAAPPAAAVGYVLSNADGDDGDTLTNYDIIGAANNNTGLFALRGARPFNFLSVPPLSRESDVGLPALLVALRLCRERQAMLLLDPPAGWGDAAAAIEGLRNWPFYSEDSLMFYPRVLAFDRLRGRFEVFGSAAAAAGLLARADQSNPVWSPAESDEALLRPGLRPASNVTDLDRIRLAQGGVNLLQSARNLMRPRIGLRTRIPEAEVKSDWRYLAPRRFALFLMTSIERGTRWVVFEPSGPPLWARVRSQVTAFLQALEQEGAFIGGSAHENYFVICDQRLNDAGQVSAGNFQLLFGLGASRPGDVRAWLVTHTVSGSSVRAASVNQYALSLQS